MIVYHATYNSRLKSIKRNGLGNTKLKNWEDSEKGVVYFADDPDIAYEYCEIVEDVSDEDYDSGIVVLCIDSEELELEEDTNQLEFAGTYSHRGIVDSNKLYVWEEDNIEKLL